MRKVLLFAIILLVLVFIAWFALIRHGYFEPGGVIKASTDAGHIYG